MNYRSTFTAQRSMSRECLNYFGPKKATLGHLGPTLDFLGPLVSSWTVCVDLGHLCRFGTRFYFSKPKGEKFEEENSPIFKNGHEL